MTENLKISITQEDIDQGTSTFLDKCPISLAVKRLTGFRTVTGSAMTRVLVNPGIWDVFRLDDVGQEFVRNFDKDKQKVSPCEITAQFLWVTNWS